MTTTPMRGLHSYRLVPLAERPTGQVMTLAARLAVTAGGSDTPYYGAQFALATRPGGALVAAIGAHQ